MIAFNTAWDAYFNAFTAALLAAFGVWLWTLRPRTRLTRTLALFAVAHGVLYAVDNVLRAGPAGSGAWRAYTVFATTLFAAAAYGLVAAAREIVPPERRRAWRLAAGAVVLLAVLGPIALGARGVLPDEMPDLALAAVNRAAFFAFLTSFAALPLVFAWVYRGASGVLRTQTISLSAALVLWPAMFAAQTMLPLVRSIGGTSIVSGPVTFALVAATGVLWLANVPLDPRNARTARNVALLVFGVLLFGMLDLLLLAEPLGYSTASGPFFGLARLATVVLLAYAALKHEVLGIDVKFRWGVSKTTVAAVFIAAFFVASEGAQLVLGRDNQVVGLVAAGALVFAMAPLQRAADRLAERAVPVANVPLPVTGVAPSRNEAAYRDALRVALRDRVLTAEEDLALARLADALHLPASRTLELRYDVERELGVRA